MDNATVLFCMISMPDGGFIGGLVDNEDLMLWDQNGKRLCVANPAKLALVPIRQHNEIIGFNAIFGPVYPMHTEQKSLLLNPSAVEILGKVQEQEDDLCIFGITQVKDLFESYKSFRQGWRAQLSGITVPTATEARNILDFPGKK